MNALIDTLESLKEANKVLEQEVEALRKENQYLAEKNYNLREVIGSWRRKALDKNPITKVIFNERHNGFEHSYEVQLAHIPADMPLHAVMTELRNHYLKDCYPYIFDGLRHHHKTGWILRLSASLPVDLSVMLDTYEEELALQERLREPYKHLFLSMER